MQRQFPSLRIAHLPGIPLDVQVGGGVFSEGGPAGRGGQAGQAGHAEEGPSTDGIGVHETVGVK